MMTYLAVVFWDYQIILMISNVSIIHKKKTQSNIAPFFKKILKNY